MRAALLGLALALYALPAHAWGPTGHRVVARVAENHMTPAAKDAARGLIGPAGLAPIATWADSIRSDPRYIGGVAGRPDTRPWHYINLDGTDDFPATTAKASGNGTQHGIRHLIDAIRHFERVLGDSQRPQADRAEALKWLVHLYGDLHQPLHVGLARDKGGNTIDVQWFGQRSNLHRVWDSGIIDRSRLSFTEIVEFIDHPTAAEINERRRGDLRAWAAEGIALRAAVYGLPPVSGEGPARLGYAYYDRHQATVYERLLTAGLRLSARLNTLLKR